MRMTAGRCIVPKRDWNSASQTSRSSPPCTADVVKKPELTTREKGGNPWFHLLVVDLTLGLGVQFRGTHSLVGSVHALM
jgi:hypothetical protein